MQATETKEIDRATLLLSVEFARVEYVKLADSEERAWKVYDNALEANETRQEIERIAQMALLFAKQKRDVYIQWQKAKLAYIGVINQGYPPQGV